MKERDEIFFPPPPIPSLVRLGKVRYSRAHEPLGPHSHGNAFEICLLARGRQTYRVEDQVYELEGGDVFLTRPDEEHDTGSRPEEKSELYFLIFSDDRTGEGFLGLGGEGDDLLDKIRGIDRRKWRGAPPLVDLLNQIFLIRDDSRGFKKERMVGRFIDFFLLLTEDAPWSGEEKERNISPPIASVLSLIEMGLDVNLSLGLLADKAGLSLSRFKERFKKETGIPPREYILRKKIERAKELLGEGRSVTFTAHELGFSSSQYFATVFKRYTGENPTLYKIN